MRLRICYDQFILLSFITIVTILFLSPTRAHIGCIEHQFYVPENKSCLDCEKCSIGMEAIPIQTWSISLTHKQGPTSCRACVPCSPGTFSDVRAFKCKICTDCGSLRKYKLKACTSERDTLCSESTIKVSTYKITTYPGNVTEKINTGTELDDGIKEGLPISATLCLIIGCMIIFMLPFIIFYAITRRRRKRSRVITSLSNEERGLYHTVSETDVAQIVIEQTENDVEHDDQGEEDDQVPSRIQEMNPLLNHRHRLKRDRYDSFPACISNPVNKETFVPSTNDVIEHIQRRGAPRIPYTRQYSYPCDARDQERLPPVTDEDILSKVGITLEKDTVDEEQDLDDVFS